MKKILLLFVLITANLGFSQSVLIPYKSGNLFGLIDEQGKQQLSPQFDEMIWMTDRYFMTTIEKDGEKLHGLIYENQELIAPQSCLSYKIVPGLMISGIFNNQTSTKNQFTFRLYDYKGNKVGTDDYLQLEMINTMGRSNRNPELAKYALLYALSLKNKISVFVFDTDLGQIKEWLFRDVDDLEVSDKSKDGKYMAMTYTDSQKIQHKKILEITKDYYTYLDNKGDNRKEAGKQSTSTREIGLQEYSNAGKKPSAKPYYSFEDGKLSYHSNKEIIDLTAIDGLTLIFRKTDNLRQDSDLIYKKGNKFGFIEDGKVLNPIYDSIAYFANSNYLPSFYLVGKKVDEGFKFGVLDSKRTELIPVIYDSIFGDIGQLKFEKKPNEPSFELALKPALNKFLPKYHSNELVYRQKFLVYKDGKSGLYNPNGESVLKVNYDIIADNKQDLPGERISYFTVLKDEGKYGLMFFDDQNVQRLIEPVFEDFPTFYIQDYYGKKDFFLIGLFDENGKFSAYASDFGVVYKD